MIRREEIVRAASVHRAILLIGARGTGKSITAQWVAESLRMEARTVRPSAVQEIEDLLMVPGDEELVSLDSLDETHGSNLSTDCCLILEDFDQLSDRPWFMASQDRLRGLFSSDAVRRRCVLFVTGRPRLWDLIGGSGSPLPNIASVFHTEPLLASEVGEWLGLDDPVAKQVVALSGGHPRVSEILANESKTERRGGGLRDLAGIAARNRAYLQSLLDDHGGQGVAVMGAVAGSGSTGVLRRNVIAAAGLSAGLRVDRTVEALIGSGLLCEDGDVLKINNRLILELPILKSVIDARGGVPKRLEPDQHAAASTTIFDLENDLRQIVCVTLAKQDPQWWNNLVHRDIRTRAEDRRSKDLDGRRRIFNMFPSEDDAVTDHPINYCDLLDLFEIVLERVRWPMTFSALFRCERAEMERCRDQVKLIRNAVAHSRPVTVAELGLLNEIHRLLVRA